MFGWLCIYSYVLLFPFLPIGRVELQIKFPCVLVEELLQGKQTILLFSGGRIANLMVSMGHSCQELQVLCFLFSHPVPRTSRPIWSATLDWPLEVDLAILLSSVYSYSLDEDWLRRELNLLQTQLALFSSRPT